MNMICAVMTQQFPRNCHQRSTPGCPVDPVADPSHSPHDDQLRCRQWGSSTILLCVTQHPADAVPLHPIRYIAHSTWGFWFVGADTRFLNGCRYVQILGWAKLQVSSVRFSGIRATWRPLATFYAGQTASHLKIRIPQGRKLFAVFTNEQMEQPCRNNHAKRFLLLVFSFLARVKTVTF